MTQTTQNINSKFFFINRSELEGRLDPNPYHKERLVELEKLEKLNCKKLKSVVIPSKSQTSLIEENDIYIGLENIKSDTGEYLKTGNKETISSANIFKRGQILFPKLRPYLNKVFLADFDGICSTEFHVFNAKDINPEYLAIYLRSSFVVNQTKHLMTGNTLPRLQTDDINNIPVPIISKDIQQKIVDLYNTVFNKKLQKEAQAQELIKSIDSYLLNELGITLPVKNNSLENRMFTVNFKEVTSGRLDPDYQNISYKNIITEIKKSRFTVTDLKDITEALNSGKTPASYEYSEEITDFPIIKVGSYTNDFIDLEKVDYVLTKQKLKAQKGDIFILSAAHQSEYVGRHIKMLNEEPQIETSYVGELICVRANEKVNSIFLFSLLKTDIYKTLINREKTGQTSHVYGKDLKKTLIPPPDKQIQDKISNHIKDIQEQIQTLQTDAKRILDEAKQEVEKMIIGN